MQDNYAPKINPPSTSGYRILIVDDDPQIQKLLSGIISYSGHSVSLANSGEDGIQLFRARPFDLVLTDFQMPVMDGLTLAFNIKTLAPHTPVVLMTDNQAEDTRSRPSGNFIDYLLFKPFGISELTDMIDTLLPPSTNIYFGRTS